MLITYCVIIKSHFRIALRFLLKNKIHSLVSILGLAVGMAGALLIFEYVSFEKSFDSFHSYYQNIFRLTSKDHETSDHRATTIPWAAPALKQNFAEVKHSTRLTPIHIFTGDTWAGYEDKKIDGGKIFLADSSFFDVFTFPFVKGNPDRALAQPYSAVITESTAQKLFGNKDPVGAMLTIDTHDNLHSQGWRDFNSFKVTGVVQDVPTNAHFNFEVLISHSTIRNESIRDNEFWNSAYSYFVLHPGTDIDSLKTRIRIFQEKTWGKGVYADQGYLDFQPLGDIHLHSELLDELQLNGDGQALDFLTVIGICILLSAYVNYVNLSTAKSAERKTEVGIRKVVGASKIQLASQLLIESLLLNALSLILAVLLAWLSIPLLEKAFNMTWPPQPDWFSLRLIIPIMAVVLTGAILSAAYPVLALASFNPINVLTSVTFSISRRQWSLGSYLMVAQFTFCLVLAICTYVMYRQLRFMKKFDMGMNINSVLVVKDYGFQPYRSYVNFKQQVGMLSSVSAVGAASAPPGEEVTMFGLRHKIKDKSGADIGELKMVSTDEGFFQVLNVDLVAGKMWDRSDSTSETKALINEAAAQLMGYQNPQDALGAIIPNFVDRDMQVIGIVKNYNQLSLRKAYEPTLYTMNAYWDEIRSWNSRYIVIRLAHTDTQDLPGLIASIQQIWTKVVSDDPFQYFFLDNFFHQQHHTDHLTGSLFIFFSGYSIFITCLGLFGLIAYAVLRRTHEIGIRKVLGATAANVILLISKDYLKILVIAVLISIPIAVWTVDLWLTQYAFKIDPGVSMFAIPVLLVAAIMAGTLIVKTSQAARANPVDALKEK